MKNGEIVSRSLSRLSVLMDFDTGPDQTDSLKRKRLLAVIIHVIGPDKCSDHDAIEHAYMAMTSETLLPEETEKAVAYLMRDNAPRLYRILSGAGKAERRRLLKTAVFTWSTYGMDCDHSTQVTERIAERLGFGRDDICNTLDRLWVTGRLRRAILTAAHVSMSVLRRIFKAMRFVAAYIAPHARHAGTRALASLQR